MTQTNHSTPRANSHTQATSTPVSNPKRRSLPTPTESIQTPSKRSRTSTAVNGTSVTPTRQSLRRMAQQDNDDTPKRSRRY